MANHNMPKTGGRKKGTPNKGTLNVQEAAARLDVDPFEVLLHFVKGDWRALGYDSPTMIQVSATTGREIVVERITPDQRLYAAREAAQYLYPKRKAREITGADGKDVFQSLTQMVQDVALRKLERQKELDAITIPVESKTHVDES